MDQRHVHLNNPAVEEEKEMDDGEDEGDGDGRDDSFKSDSDFREESDSEQGEPGSQSRKRRQAAQNQQSPRVEDVDDLIDDVAERLRPQNQEDNIQLQQRPTSSFGPGPIGPDHLNPGSASQSKGVESPRFHETAGYSPKMNVLDMPQRTQIDQRGTLGGLFATPTFNKVVLDTLVSRSNDPKPIHDYKYENFTYCKELLRKGISARKFHYSKKGHDDCTLMVNQDFTKLQWQYQVSLSNKKSAISEIQGFSYGALSGTFYQYRDDIFSKMKEINEQLYQVQSCSKEADTAQKPNEQPAQDSSTNFLGRLKSKTFGETLQLSQQDIQQPFYSWQCISLYLDYKTVDFVIEDEEHLFAFINFINVSLTDQQNATNMKRLIGKSAKLSFKNLMPAKQPSQTTSQGGGGGRGLLMGSVLSGQGAGGGGNILGGYSSKGSEGPGFITKKPQALKAFRLMKIKMKIAYSALQSGQIVLDFITNAIIKTYVELSIPSMEGSFILDDNAFFKWRWVFPGKNAMEGEEASERSEPNRSYIQKPNTNQAQSNDDDQMIIMNEIANHSPRADQHCEEAPFRDQIFPRVEVTTKRKQITNPQTPFDESSQQDPIKERHSHAQRIAPEIEESLCMESRLEEEDYDDEEEKVSEYQVSSSRHLQQSRGSSKKSKQSSSIRSRCRKEASLSATRVQDMDDTKLPQFEEYGSQNFRRDIVQTTEVSMDKTLISPYGINTTGVHYQSPQKKKVAMTAGSSSSWLQMARRGAFTDNKVAIKNTCILNKVNKKGQGLRQMLNLSDDQGDYEQDTIIKHPCLAERESEKSLKEKDGSPLRSGPAKQSQHPKIVIHSVPDPTTLQAAHSYKLSPQNKPSSNFHLAPSSAAHETAVTQATNMQKSLSFPRRARTGCYSHQQAGPDTEEYQLRLVQEKYELDQKLNGDHQAQIYQIHSELIRPNGREASRLDQTTRDDDNSIDQFILLESPEIAATGFELGGKKNTFVRRARTQRSMEHSPDNTPGKKFDKVVEETNKMRDLELNRLELFFKLVVRKIIESPENYDSHVMIGSPSMRYYETQLVFDFHRLNDYNDGLSKRVLAYLRSIKDQLLGLKDRKSFLLRRNLVFLSRREKDQYKKIYQQQMQEELEGDPSAKEYIRAILSFRQKKGISKKEAIEGHEPNKGWFYWLSLGCVRSKSTHTLDKKPSEEEDREPGILNLKLSPIKGVQVDKPLPKSPIKQAAPAGNLAMTIAQSKSILNLIGIDNKKVTNIFNVVKLLGTSPIEVQDEKIEQLKLKQMMNLRAKGFFLDNAEEIIALESRKKEEHFIRMKDLKKKQIDLLAILDDEDPDVALAAANELQVLSLKISNTMTVEEQQELRFLKLKKLKALQNRLQSNSDATFAGFKGELDGVKRATRKMQILTDRLEKEEMYFNPALSKLGQIRLARSLKKQRTSNTSSLIKFGGTIGGPGYEICHSILDQSLNPSEVGGMSNLNRAKKK